MSNKRRLSALAMAIAGVLGSVQSASADTFIWQGISNDQNNPSGGRWSTESYWNTNRFPAANPDFPDYTNRASNEIVFGGSNVNGPYTTWHDLDINGAPVELNILRFNSTATVGANTISQVNPDTGAVSAGALRFVNNGSTTPRLIQDRNGAFNVDVPIEFSVNTIFSGAGTGLVSLRNTLTGPGAWDIQGGNTAITGSARITTAPSITFGNSGGGGALTLDGGGTSDRLADTIGVTFNVGGGTLAVGGSSGAASETVGSVTVNAGANRLQANGASMFTITSFTRKGGVVDFASTGGTLGTGAGGPRILIGNAPANVNGIIGGWATVNSTDFASYGANGVTAYTGGYTPLPASNFDSNTNYEATGSVALTGGGNIFTVRLNHSSNQTLDLGANNLNVTGGILKIGAGTTTINGTGSLGGGAGELVLHVNQGALTLNAPFTATTWTKAGTGALTISPTGNVPWQSVGFSGPLVMNVTADTTVSGQLAGAGSLTKNGNGKLTLTGSGTAGGAISGWSGGTTINGGTVELLATSASPNVNLAGGNNYLGSSGNININGATLKVTTGQNGNTTGNINLTRAVVFGGNGGLLDLTNSVGGTLGGGTSTNVAGFPGVTIGGGNSSFSLTTSANAATPAVIRFNGGQVGYADPATPRNWTSGNTVRFSSLNGTGALRVELSNGGSVRLGTGSGSAQNISVPFTVSGTPLSDGGDSSSGLQGLNDPGLSKTTGRVVVDNAPSINHQNGLFLAGALQVAPVGASRALDGNITIRGTASGNPGFVSFAGRGTGTALGPTIRPLNANTGDAGQHPLWLGQGGDDTLTIEDGGTASLDLRIRSDQNNHNGVFLDAQTVINAGGTLRFTQSMSASSGFSGQSGGNVGYHNVGNNITGQGTTAKESTIDLFLGRADTNAANLPVNGVNFAGTNVAVVVNGSGLGGLRVNGKALPNKLFAGGAADPTSGADKIANLLTQARLAGLTGTGGYLTVAPQSGTFALPTGGEWAANVPVGLRVGTVTGGSGTVALPTGGTWAHNLHVDSGAELGVNGVTVNNNATPTTPTVVSGLGTLNAGTGGVTFATGVTVAPGAAGVAGTLSAKGNAKLNAGATLKAEITGATFGSLQSTDSVDVTGSTLTVTPTNVPSGAHRWDVVATDTDANAVGSVVGKFGTVNLPANESGQLGRIWSVVYEPTKVGVGFTIAGDANYDGTVNFADLLALAKNYNQTNAQWTQGNFNPSQDSTVNFADLLALAKNYNAKLPADIPGAIPGASAAFEADVAAAFAAVPEPGTLGLVGIGLTSMLAGRRRRRRA